MVRNKFPNKNKYRNYPDKQRWYDEGSLSCHHMRNVALILIITVLMAALTSITVYFIDKLQGMDNSQIRVTAFSLRDQLKEVLLFDSIVSGGKNSRYIN